MSARSKTPLLDRVTTQHLSWRGLLDSTLKFRPMALPDRLIDHDSQPRQYDDAGLNASHIVAAVLAALGLDAVTSKPSLPRTK